MKTIKSILVAFSVIVLLSAVPALGQVGRNSVVSNPQLAKQVRHELVTLPYYGVFDNLAYNINGGTVTLYGQVVRPAPGLQLKEESSSFLCFSGCK
jgi:hyperosmotically inducible protein